MCFGALGYPLLRDERMTGHKDVMAYAGNRGVTLARCQRRMRLEGRPPLLSTPLTKGKIIAVVWKANTC